MKIKNIFLLFLAFVFLTTPAFSAPPMYGGPGDQSNVAITGGTINGITDLAIGDGGTGASTAAAAFSNLKQNATTSATGVVELATPTESVAGSSTTLVNTPSGAAAQIAVHTNPKAMSQGVAMTYAATGGGIMAADDAKFDPTTNDFTLFIRASLPDWTPAAAAAALLEKWSGSYTGFDVGALTDGTFRLRVYRNDGGTVFTSTATHSFVDGTEHLIEIGVRRETASTAGEVTFRVDGALFGNALPITAAATVSIDNTGGLGVLGFTGARTAGKVSFAGMFNRVLTVAESLDLYRNGVAEADKWGSQTSLTSEGGLTVDAADIAAINAAYSDIDVYVSAAHNANIASKVLTWNITSDGSNSILLKTGLTIGKRYRINGLNVTERTASFNLRGTHADAGTSTYYTFATTGLYNIEFTALTNSVYLGGYATGTFAITQTNPYTITPIGATLALEPEGIQPAPGQWLDSSSNKLHAWQPASGSSITRYKNTFEIRGINTWAGTHEAQSITMLTDASRAMLPVDCYITDIIGVITGATIEDIIIGDGSDTDRWVAITTGLAAGTVAFTPANRISDGTNYEMVVDPDADFTGSIEWTIRGIIID